MPMVVRTRAWVPQYMLERGGPRERWSVSTRSWISRLQARGGFTLIELLVVISIIALLIGILLPALAAARESGRTIVCASRMREVATGWQIYANENHDISVPAQPGRYYPDELNLYDVGNGLHYRPRWFVLLGAAGGFYAYSQPSVDVSDEHSLPVDGSDVFLCPNAADWISTRNYAYGYNHQFLGNTRFRRNDDPTSGLIRFPVKASSLDASITVMAADSLGTAAGKPAALRTPNRPDGSRDPQLLAEGGHGYALDPPRMTENCDYADIRNRAPENRSAPHERHRGKANFSWCDGHVSTDAATALGYVKRGDGSFEAITDEATNAKFSGRGTDEDPPRLVE
ncbi:MAG: prepilin-type N-terminal cleavage/methylation domain-containing protein [Leptolyngbya sp. PLA3]|nr:MAG: prepilin-type N-terminal cleavage/methylation domain-containing protein [Cyanobacteria bacterium CYA]MCE7968006.1 prepilin-type N-terminal cleavage/methylation domain-containing protein [Leptolyngbya sp. PL-A3]